MNRFAVFLRGINVGGHAAISMEELKGLLSEHHYSKVSSYINSGNLIVNTESGKEEAHNNISALIRTRFGIEVEVFLQTFIDLRNILDHDRFDASIVKRESWKMVIMLSRKIEEAELKMVTGDKHFDEIFYSHTDVIYVYYPNGSGNSKFSTNLIENRLKLRATARNWNTISKMKSLLEDDS